MEQQEIYVGVDVSKYRLDVAARPSGDVWEVRYDESGIEELVLALKSLNPTMVLLEASGGMELRLVSALAVASLPVVVVNPRQVRDFARATGKLAKTDALDAKALAHFAEAVRHRRVLCRTPTSRLSAHCSRADSRWYQCLCLRRTVWAVAPMRCVRVSRLT